MPTTAAPQFAYPQSVRQWVLVAISGCMGCAFGLAIVWYLGLWPMMQFRPLLYAGGSFWALTCAWLIYHKRRQRILRGKDFRWLQFSLLEVIVFMTGMSLFLGLSAADRHQEIRQRSRQAVLQEQVQAATATVFGLDGQIFYSDGKVMIAICDRSFDDQRLAAVDQLLQQHGVADDVVHVMFGSGPRTAATPAAWPGVTDASVPTLLKWGGLETLEIHGTGISPAGIERLQALPQLATLQH